jgi:glycine betaine catabolism B
MSLSDARPRLVDGKFAKWFVILCGLVPGVLLFWDALHHKLGVNATNFVIRTTGIIGLVLLALSLAVTPLRRLTGVATLISVRRNLGVLGFAYIVAHFAVFFWWDRMHDIGSTFHEIVMRRYLWFGFGALVLMIPLAITSTDGMVSRVGAKRWKLLHRLAYPIVIAGVVHYWLLVKSDLRQPIAFAIAVGVFLLFRVVAHYLDLRKEVRVTREKAQSARAAMPKARKFWSGELQIARIFDEAHDVKTFRLVSPDGGPLPFQHIAGQYINLHLTVDGRRLNRSYTIASSPTRNAYCEISVKKSPNGNGGSKHLHETWREGARVKVAAPAGKFYFAGTEAEQVVLIAGGIGITPMMSVVRSLTDRGWKGEIYLLFSVRKVADIVFRDELAYLQARFPNLHVKITVTSDPDAAWDGARGQITKELIADFVPKLGRVMLCGPDPMMTAMRALLVSLGVPDGEIHQEAFISTPPEPLADGSAIPVEVLEPGVLASIRFSKANKVAESTDLTVLEAAEECGVSIPNECRSGICGQCKTRLISGKVVMEVQDALTSADRAKGLVLACQARAAQDVAVDA